jgi:hypothetical protein
MRSSGSSAIHTGGLPLPSRAARARAPPAGAAGAGASIRTGAGRLPCGIYHVPYFVTEDGGMPILCVAMPDIAIVATG